MVCIYNFINRKTILCPVLLILCATSQVFGSMVVISYELSTSLIQLSTAAAADAAAKSLQLCPTLCDPIDASPPGFSNPGILQARTLEWVAISFSNARKWKVKVKSLSHVDSSQPHGLQPTRLLHPCDFPGKSTGVGCHCLLCNWVLVLLKSSAFFCFSCCCCSVAQ